MADKRPFAKIDTGYIMNPKWFQAERVIRDVLPNVLPNEVPNVIRTAQVAHIASILYAAQNQTDGAFPVRAIKAIIGATTELDEAAITALFEVGMWVNQPGGMAEIKDYLEHQTSAAEIRAASERARKAIKSRWSENTERNTSSNTERNTERNTEEKRKEEKRILKAHQAQCANEFDEWWNHYPVKRDKKKAFDAFVEARKKVDLQTLTVAADKYSTWCKANPERTPKYAQGWLNGERWTDDLGPITGSSPQNDRVKAWRARNGQPPIPQHLFDNPTAANAWGTSFLQAIGDGANDQQAAEYANQQTGQ